MRENTSTSRRTCSSKPPCCGSSLPPATSTTAINLDTNGTASVTNNVALGTGHVKAIVDTMKERNIPAVYHGRLCFRQPSDDLRSFKNTLETMHQYTETGLAHIFNGEIGRYESNRFIEQTFIPPGGAADSTTYDPWSGTADAWDNGLSSWAFFLGADTVTEAICIPEEIRAKIPGDYRPFARHRLVLSRRLWPRASRRDECARGDVGFGDLIGSIRKPVNLKQGAR